MQTTIRAAYQVLQGLVSSVSSDEQSGVVTDGAGSTPEHESRAGDMTTMTDTNIGIYGIPNSLNSDLIEESLDTARKFVGVDIPAKKMPDVDMGRNPLRVEDVAPMVRDRMEAAILELSHEADWVLVPSSLGTGYVLYQIVDLDLVFEGRIDMVVPDHRIAPSSLYKYPSAALLAGINSALLEPPAILMNHRHDELDSVKDVQWELAKICGLLATDLDIANRSYGYTTMAMTTVPMGGRAEIDLSPAIKRAAANLEPWATTTQWTPWAVENGEVDADEPLPARTDPVKLAIVPHGVELGQHDELRIIHANVDTAEVLAFWQLEPEFVKEHIRSGGAEWVDAEIRDEQSPIHSVWQQHARKFGSDDPIARWDEYYEDHIEPELNDM